MKRVVFCRMLIALFLLQLAPPQANTVNFIFQAPGKNWVEEFEFDPQLDSKNLAESIVASLAGIGNSEGYEDVTTISLSTDLTITQELAGGIQAALADEVGLRSWTFQAQFNQENKCENAAFHHATSATPASRSRHNRLTYHFDFTTGIGHYSDRTGELDGDDDFPIYCEHDEQGADEDIEDEDGEEEDEYSGDDEDEDEAIRIAPYIRRATNASPQ